MAIPVPPQIYISVVVPKQCQIGKGKQWYTICHQTSLKNTCNYAQLLRVARRAFYYVRSLHDVTAASTLSRVLRDSAGEWLELLSAIICDLRIIRSYCVGDFGLSAANAEAS